ncbi:MAG: arginase family protein [Candidatus Diapherotrites archaeon]|nr:arginase family protein [Candidatus Diapherotrites archaeon]
MKIAWQNCYSLDAAEIVVFGVLGQEGAIYTGTEQAPNEIRAASAKWLYAQPLSGKSIAVQPQGGPIRKKVLDAYNIDRKEMSSFVERLALKKKIPAMLGGGHAYTLEALKGIAGAHKDFSVVYFDSRLEMVSGEGISNSSVFSDALSLHQLKMQKSACAGCRAFRESELEKAKKQKLLVIPAVEVEQEGVKKTFRKIKKRVGKKVYLSFDIGCIDPSSAPGVSEPVPAGLTANQALSLAKMVAANGIVGFDIVEVNPLLDRSGITASLAAKILSEIIAGIR